MDVIILGCGFTGQRVARRFLRRGARVIATTRNIGKLDDIRALGAEVYPYSVELPSELPFSAKSALVLHSIPTVDGADFTPAILTALGSTPARIVYLSTTGVYGPQPVVTADSAPNPKSPRERLRLDAEHAVSSGPWSSIILRPAAIYGPGRGIHVSMARREYRLAGDGSNFVSRIHVEDLATHVEAALLSTLEGAWPVADDHPCTSREIAGFCATLLAVPMPPSVDPAGLHFTRRTDRRVDGSAIRKRLGISLQYPTYREGIPACLSAG